MAIKTGKDGTSYQHYLKDEKGQKILRENATPEQLAKSKNAVAVVEGGDTPALTSSPPSSKSQWLMVKKTAKSGKVYQHYLKDAKGQRIPRSTATEEQIAMTMEIQGAKNEKAVKKAKRGYAKMNKMLRAKAKRRKLPVEIANSLRDAFDGQKKETKSIRSGEFAEKNADYHVVMFDIETDWLLIHSTIKKGQQQYVEEWFFFNPYNGDWAAFDVVTYLATDKDTRSVDWPTRSTKADEAA